MFKGEKRKFCAFCFHYIYIYIFYNNLFTKNVKFNNFINNMNKNINDVIFYLNI